MRLQQDLRESIELLNSNQCAFLVVGGHAVAFHGHPRFTGDIDFLTLPSMQNKRAAGRPKDLADVAELQAVHAAKK
jgi:hypothetical protein